jgi:hypothetical protein
MQNVEQKGGRDTFIYVALSMQSWERRTPLKSRSYQSFETSSREDFSEYVAHLQLHMTLQARNLVPTITQAADSREQLLQQTQAHFEKLVSRQVN